MDREEALQVRVTESARDKLEILAKVREMKLSEYLRWVLLNHIKIYFGEDKIKRR